MTPEEKIKSLETDIQTLYKVIASLELQNRALENRWKNSNALANSYAHEFMERGLIYTPKTK